MSVKNHKGRFFIFNKGHGPVIHQTTAGALAPKSFVPHGKTKKSLAAYKGVGHLMIVVILPLQLC